MAEINRRDTLCSLVMVLLSPTLSLSAHTKNGYLWYAETRTFGTTWIRLFFSIRKGMLVSSEVYTPLPAPNTYTHPLSPPHAYNAVLLSFQSTSKVKVPISLSLNLCNVKVNHITLSCDCHVTSFNCHLTVSQPAQVTDTERNFCFKVISPVRILILQAESTQGN